MISRYQTIKVIKDKNKQIFNQVYYPMFGNDEDYYYILTSYNDRFDLIALDFFNDESLWWILPMVNNLSSDSMYPEYGIQLMIPKNIQNIINSFLKENEI